MKSGLEDRNNDRLCGGPRVDGLVSMKSGLEDRNNPSVPLSDITHLVSQ